MRGYNDLGTHPSGSSNKRGRLQAKWVPWQHRQPRPTIRPIEEFHVAPCRHSHNKPVMEYQRERKGQRELELQTLGTQTDVHKWLDQIVRGLAGRINYVIACPVSVKATR